MPFFIFAILFNRRLADCKYILAQFLWEAAQFIPCKRPVAWSAVAFLYPRCAVATCIPSMQSSCYCHCFIFCMIQNLVLSRTNKSPQVQKCAQDHKERKIGCLSHFLPFPFLFLLLLEKHLWLRVACILWFFVVLFYLCIELTLENYPVFFC